MKSSVTFLSEATRRGVSIVANHRAKPRDHNGGAIRPGDLGKPRDLRLRSEFCTPAFPCPVQDVCGLRDGKTRIPTGASNRIPSSSGV